MSCEDLCTGGEVVYIRHSGVRSVHTRSHNNARGQCRDSTSPFQKASSCKPSDGSKNTEAVEVKKIDYIYLCPFSPQKFLSF